MQIAIEKIHPASDPIRTSWDEEKLNELAASIAEQGLIVPIKVRPTATGYEVVYGHRRLEAMRRNGATEIEAIVEGMEDTDALIQALIENLQREDLSPIEEANGYLQLMSMTNATQDQVARKVGRNQPHISRTLLLLSQPREIREIVENSGGGGRSNSVGMTPISARHIQEIAYAGGGSLDDEIKVNIARKIAQEGLTSDQTRRVAESVAAAPSEQAKKVLLEQEYSPLFHDPERIRQRAKEVGTHDPLYQQPSQQKQEQRAWDSTPEVKIAIEGVIAAAKQWTILITELRKMVAVGKLAPEGKIFTASRLRSLARTLESFADELERENSNGSH